MTTPLRTPGGRREDTAQTVGSTVGSLMTAAANAVITLLAPAVTTVLHGGSQLTAGRRLRAQSTAIMDLALDHTGIILASAAERITAETTGSLTAAAPSALFAPPPTVPPASSWSAIEEQLRGAGLNVLRDQDDVWRQAVEAALSTGGVDAAQKVLTGLAERGLTAYLDKAGRQWTLPAYATMATRTAATRLALAVQMQAMAARGLDLVMIDKTSTAEGCPRCLPFEYRVLSLSGQTPIGTAVSVVDANGLLRIENVKTSLTQAVAAGLLHPSCRHFAVPWTDGMVMTTPLPSVRRDGPSYAAQQKQRALHREVQRAAAGKSLALTPLVKARANRELVAAHARLVEHMSGTLPVQPPARKPLQLVAQRRPVDIAPPEKPAPPVQPRAPRRKRPTKAERSALFRYTGSEYISMNDYLTNGRRIRGPARKDLDYVKHVTDSVEALERLTDRYPLKKPKMVTRSIPRETATKVFGPVGSKVRKTFVDKRFVSTTKNLTPSPHFGPVTLRYNLKPGVRALDVTNIREGNAYEKEVILSPGQRFRVISDQIDDRGRRIIELESA